MVLIEHRSIFGFSRRHLNWVTLFEKHELVNLIISVGNIALWWWWLPFKCISTRQLLMLLCCRPRNWTSHQRTRCSISSEASPKRQRDTPRTAKRGRENGTLLLAVDVRAKNEKEEIVRIAAAPTAKAEALSSESVHWREQRQDLLTEK